MNAEMTKASLLETLCYEHAQWKDLLAQVGEARMDEVGVEGAWSVKDIVGHITAYEGWAAQHLQELARGEPHHTYEIEASSLDARIARIFAQNRQRSPADVLRESEQVFEQLLRAVQATPESDLFDTQRFAWTEGKPLADYYVSSDSYEHYHEHSPNIQAWLAKHTAGA